jgi:2-iminobutanoate/2-iminopropanoate deaminase
MRRAIRAPNAPGPGGAYSQAIRWGGLLFISGQTPRALDRQVVTGSFRVQAEQVYANLRSCRQGGSCQ